MSFRIENSQRVNFVIEEVNPEGHARSHGENVHNRTPDSILAVLKYCRDASISSALELPAHLADIEFLRLFKDEAVTEDERRWGHPLEQGGRRYDENTAVSHCQLVQYFQTFRNNILMG